MSSVVRCASSACPVCHRDRVKEHTINRDHAITQWYCKWCELFGRAMPPRRIAKADLRRR